MNGSKKEASAVGESVIRKMTRLATEHGAVNLSQGFPNEPPPLPVRIALARAVITGMPIVEGNDGSDVVDQHHHLDLTQALANSSSAGDSDVAIVDVLNQYSPPMGRLDLRKAIAQHYERLYGYRIDNPEECITVTLGATEAVASALRTIGKPGDKVAIFEPYHELYPSQCKIFYLTPIFVTLHESETDGQWTFNETELESALSQAKMLVLNTPHNPTGKVFTHEELTLITDLCIQYDVYIITDEIYEHMTYGKHRGKHLVLPQVFSNVAERTLVCNSMGKSASATGWRLGWCIHPRQFTSIYRGVHDQLVVMAPHPMQYAALTYLTLPLSYFQETLAVRYLDRMQMLSDALKRVGFLVSQPEGAYYLFAKYRSVNALQHLDPLTAAMFMMERIGVACVPGDNFYGSDSALQKEGQEYLRFAACRSVEDVKEACVRLKALLLN